MANTIDPAQSEVKTPPRWAWHEFRGNTRECDECGLPRIRHRKADTRKRTWNRKDTRDREGRYQVEWIGIDGEGQGRDDHKYVFLAASNESGTRRWSIENPNGISTEEFLDFILQLPSEHCRIMCYSFNYDLTKGLKDLPNDKLYQLFRPELRKRHGKEQMKGPIPRRWNFYTINMQGTKFWVRKTGLQNRIVWDIWKFFQCKFVEALQTWKVGDPELLARMQRMKDKRAEFDKLDLNAVKEYCFEECQCMAALARKLFEAHETAGLRLKNFYGAGSSAGAMLNVMDIKSKLVPTPKGMVGPVAQAFFGGRFENSIIGIVRQRVYNWDISSAYPYQLCFLPCLEHAKWELTTNYQKMLDARHALVHYGLSNSRIRETRITSWAPFPFRDDKGSICYPRLSGGGWIWRDEYIAGERAFPYVEFREAWICHSDCACKPFQRIPGYYMERCRIGKEGPGIVLKLGTNSVYGKLAQSVGQAQFNSWIWAGMITSGCRAQILQMLSLHKKRSNMLMVATDGIFTLEDIRPPMPKPTGTDDATVDGKPKPLGGWERKVIDKGVFIARPGVYFPLDPTPEELKTIRGRGVGKGTILENWETIVKAWEENGLHEYIGHGGKDDPCHHCNKIPRLHNTVAVSNVSRFCGAKTSISRSGPPGHYTYKRAGEVAPQQTLFKEKEPVKEATPRYGQWITRKIIMSFNPMPKREGLNTDGVTLKLRDFPMDKESVSYKKATRSQDSREMEAQRIQMMEQPDGDLADYEHEDD